MGSDARNPSLQDPNHPFASMIQSLEAVKKQEPDYADYRYFNLNPAGSMATSRAVQRKHAAVRSVSTV